MITTGALEFIFTLQQFTDDDKWIPDIFTNIQLLTVRRWWRWTHQGNC